MYTQVTQIEHIKKCQIGLGLDKGQRAEKLSDQNCLATLPTLYFVGNTNACLHWEFALITRSLPALQLSATCQVFQESGLRLSQTSFVY